MSEPQKSRSRRRPGQRRHEDTSATGEQHIAKEKNPKKHQETTKSVTFTAQISVKISMALYGVMENYINAAIEAGDYRLANVADFMREALDEFRDGKKLVASEQDATAEKETTLRVTSEQYTFWHTLPRRHKRSLLERAIRSKLSREEGA